MTLRPYIVLDVFTATPLEGNPVAVFTEAVGMDGGLMQRVARELNLSETVFLAPGDDEADATLRIFTPATELPFAGHPVLGTAFVVAGERAEATVRLRTGAGVVPVVISGGEGEMAQPLPAPAELPDPAAALRALGVTEPRLPPAAYSNGPVHAFVGLHRLADVSDLRPDMSALGDLGALGWSCFAEVDPEGGVRTVRSRMFAPGLGVAEDPATGSAAGPLAVHLVREGLLEPGEPLRIHQGVEMGRPSLLKARAEGTRDRIEAVHVGGSAVLVGRGEYRLP